MERRKFLKATCQLCVLGAAGYVLPSLLSCSAARSSVYKATINNKQIEVPLTIFENNSLQMVRPKGWFYDIAVQKNADTTYAALLMKCTHMDNQLVHSGETFHCNLHGSEFDKNGQVKKGPAEISLTQYKTSMNQTHLIITV